MALAIAPLAIFKDGLVHAEDPAIEYQAMVVYGKTEGLDPSPFRPPRLLPAQDAGGYQAIDRPFQAGEMVRVRFAAPLRAEDRRFRELKIPGGALSRLREACLALGPDLLACLPSPTSGRPAIPSFY